MHRSDFCIAGAFRDMFLFRDFFRIRSLFLLVTAISVLTMIGRLFGLIETYPPSFFGLPSLVNLIGGTAFGAGMVMAGGCMIGTLYKLGSGKLISAFSFMGILIGTVLYAEVQPSVRVLTSKTTLSLDKTAFEHIAGPPWIYALILLIVFIFFLYRWTARGAWTARVSPTMDRSDPDVGCYLCFPRNFRETPLGDNGIRQNFGLYRNHAGA